MEVRLVSFKNSKKSRPIWQRTLKFIFILTMMIGGRTQLIQNPLRFSSERGARINKHMMAKGLIAFYFWTARMGGVWLPPMTRSSSAETVAVGKLNRHTHLRASQEKRNLSVKVRVKIKKKVINKSGLQIALEGWGWASEDIYDSRYQIETLETEHCLEKILSPRSKMSEGWVTMTLKHVRLY